jgi:hypothetical protein
MEDKLYISAFNAGYIVEKYAPALSQLLKKSLGNTTSSFIEGFNDGSNQYASEKKERDLLISIIKGHDIRVRKSIDEPDKDEPEIDI